VIDVNWDQGRFADHEGGVSGTSKDEFAGVESADYRRRCRILAARDTACWEFRIGCGGWVALRWGICCSKIGRDAALEMTLMANVFVPDGAVICRAGANFEAQVDGKLLSCGAQRDFAWKKGCVGPTKDFARAICAWRENRGGGISGSASTHLLSGLGGWEVGRCGRRHVADWKARKKYPAEKIADGILEELKPKKTFAGERGPQPMVSGRGAGDAGRASLW